MSTCALRRDCNGARASKQRSTMRPHASARRRQRGVCGARHVDVARTASSPSRCEHRERGRAPCASRSSSVPKPHLRPPPGEHERRRPSAGHVDRDDAAPRAASGNRGARRPAASGGDEQLADGAATWRTPTHLDRRRGGGASASRDHVPSTASSATVRSARAHVRDRHVLGDRDAQRAREVARDTSRARDPRQLLDAARDRAGVDEQQRVRRCARRACATISSRVERAARPRPRTWSTSSSGDCTARYASADARRHAPTTTSSDPQPARPGLALHLDAALADARIDRRRPRALVGSRSSSSSLAGPGRSRRGAARARGARRSRRRRGAATSRTSAYDVGRARARARRRRSSRASPTPTAPPTRRPLQPAASMSRPGRVAGRVGEHRARVLAAGLVLAPPAHDLVDAARRTAPGRRRARRTSRADDDRRGAERRACGSRGRARRGSSVADRRRRRGRTTRARDEHVGGLARRGRPRSCAPRRRRDPGMPDEELEAADARRRGPPGQHRAAPPRHRRRRARRPRGRRRACSNSPPSDERDAVEAGVGDEQVRAAPDHEHRDVVPARARRRPPRRSSSRSARTSDRERAAAAVRRERRARHVALDPPRQRALERGEHVVVERHRARSRASSSDAEPDVGHAS